MLDDINKQIEDCPETPFDQFDLKIDLRKSGAALREELVKFSNLYGRISQLASNALLLYKKAENRLEKVESLAWEKITHHPIKREMKVSEKKKFVKTIPIISDGEETTLNEEEEKLIIFEYLNNRGKDKVKEISSLLDIGRTLLSWDKNEMSQNMN